MKTFDARGNRDHFLNDFAARQGSDQTGPRSGEEDAVKFRSQSVLRFEPRQELQNFFRLLRIMPLIRLGDDFTARRGENVLARGAPHVDAADLGAIRGGTHLLRRLDFHHAGLPHQGRDLNKIPVSHERLLASPKNSFRRLVSSNRRVIESL